MIWAFFLPVFKWVYECTLCAKYHSSHFFIRMFKNTVTCYCFSVDTTGSPAKLLSVMTFSLQVDFDTTCSVLFSVHVELLPCYRHMFCYSSSIVFISTNNGSSTTFDTEYMIFLPSSHIVHFSDSIHILWTLWHYTQNSLLVHFFSLLSGKKFLTFMLK